MDGSNKLQTKMIRIGQLLRILMEQDKVTSHRLSRQFQTSTRTIQRDLLLLKESGFPLHEIQKGVYSLKKDIVKSLEVFDDTELAMIVAVKNTVEQLGVPFQRAADSILDRLYDSVINMPVFVKIDDSVIIDSSLFNKIIKAIREKKQIGYQYESNTGRHPVVLEPYRVVYFSGFWYVMGNEIETKTIKRYALDKIADLTISRTTFSTIPENIDSLLQHSANIWSTNAQNIQITIMVDAKVSHYFKRKKMFPSQTIIEEKNDGRLVVSYTVGHYEAIRNMLKSWIPRIVVLSPTDFRNEFLADVKEWIKKQEGENTV